MWDEDNADKYNEGSRIYNKFPLIVNNCARCYGIDIRDLTLKELSLAINMSWLVRRAVLTKAKKKAVPGDVSVDVKFCLRGREKEKFCKYSNEVPRH